MPISLADLEALKENLSGPIAVPGDSAYAILSAAFNKVGTPEVIVTAHDADDVSAAVNFARDHSLAVSVRSSGHGMAGFATNDGGLVIDLTSMRGIELLDEETHIVRLEPGAPWGEVAGYLQEYDLALTSGDNGSVAVGGLTLGGGVGWMVRKFGLTIDRLRAAELVLADGSQLRVDADNHPDLFWAIRGGGGNFGVVTAFEFEAHPGTQVISGLVYYSLDELEKVLSAWGTYMQTAPEDLSATAIVFPPQDGQPGALGISICYASGDEQAAIEALEPMLSFGTVLDQRLAHASYASLLPYHGSMPFGQFQAVHRTALFKELSKEALAALRQNFAKPGAPLIEIRALGGAMARVLAEATAFAHREARFLATSMKMVEPGSTLAAAQQTANEVWQSLAAFASGMYVNFVEFDTDKHLQLIYPQETYDRLVKIKRSYDPENLFSQNVNIKPE